MVLMLLVTGALYALWGEPADAITIFVIILTLNTVEVGNELRAKKAVAALRKLAEPTASVRRDGHFRVIPVEQIVPGDLILLQEGRRVPADARLVDAFGLSVDESTLTGESLPVEKEAQGEVSPAAPLAERANCVFSSTLITRGKGTALVTATGVHSEIGRIAGLASRLKEPRTPLQQAMEELSRVLIWFALGFSVLVPLVGIFAAHQPPRQMLLTGLSLAFATIPEELPILITMVLGLGAFRLSRKNAIARRLNAVEALGAVTVIATDKTGTLTENRIEVTAIEPQEVRLRLLETGALANDAVLDECGPIGNPLDAALLRAARHSGIDPAVLRRERPLLDEFSFDNIRRRMSVVYRWAGQRCLAAKGAPEAVLSACTLLLDGETIRPLTPSDRREILDTAARMADDGLRLIAFAERALPEGELPREQAETGLTWIGLAGLADPPRAEVPMAIAACRRAGVRTIMITGDHPLTARAIARQVGLDTSAGVMTGTEIDRLADAELAQVVRQKSVYARTTPEHKLRIVQALQELGERVAVTGDGVNDAPALAAADIGVAMGETGTDVARETSDLVLADDNFSTLVAAIAEGRLIFENLKKGVRYYLACKLALTLIILVPALLLVPVPFAPVQIIVMELFMDLMAAAAFVAEPAEADLLDRPPRNPRARFMDRAMIASIVPPALGLFAEVNAVYLAAWYGSLDPVSAQTTAFFAWLIGHVLLAFNLRTERQPVSQLGWGSNRMMWVWAAGVAGFLLLAAFAPGVQELMKVTALDGTQWVMIATASLLGTCWLEVRKLATYRGRRSS